MFWVAHIAWADPQSNYLLHCGGCHLESGEGTRPDVPDLRRDLDWLASSSAGRSYLTRVPGASQVPLSDAKLAEIYNWMFEVFYPEATNIRSFSADEIAGTRHLPLYNPLEARKALLQKHMAQQHLAQQHLGPR